MFTERMCDFVFIFFLFLLFAYSRVYGDSQTNLSVSQGHILYIGLFKQELLNCTQMVYWITGDLWYSLNNFTSCTSLQILQFFTTLSHLPNKEYVYISATQNTVVVSRINWNHALQVFKYLKNNLLSLL